MERGLRILGMVLIGIWLVTLFLYDPEHNDHFLSCPFEFLTGLACPGCGAQRAMHDLMHGRVGEAFGHNAALVCSLPLLGVQWATGRIRGVSPGTDNRVVYAWGIALVAWGVVRNLPGMEVLAP